MVLECIVLEDGLGGCCFRGVPGGYFWAMFGGPGAERLPSVGTIISVFGIVGRLIGSRLLRTVEAAGDC